MKRKLASTLLVPLLLTVASCGSTGTGSGSSLPSSYPTSDPSVYTSAGPEPSESTSADAAPADDLATGKARHVIQSSGVTATVYYETRKPDVAWTTVGEKPLRVEVKVSRPKKKVYLTRVTLRFSVDDGSGELPGPDPIVDTPTNVAPGYLVAPPYSYVQAFAIPPVDPSVVSLNIDVKLELVSLVDAKAKDYTKQTVTDRISTTIVQ
jgi:hypothetical protein